VAYLNGVFTVTRPGLYHVYCDIDTFDADGPVDLWVQKNGDDSNGKFGFKTALTEDTTALVLLVYLQANDTIRVKMYNHGSTFSTPSRPFKFNEFAIKL
jgi:hypothetical protein